MYLYISYIETLIQCNVCERDVRKSTSLSEHKSRFRIRTEEPMDLLNEHNPAQ